MSRRWESKLLTGPPQSASEELSQPVEWEALRKGDVEFFLQMALNSLSWFPHVSALGCKDASAATVACQKVSEAES